MTKNTQNTKNNIKKSESRASYIVQAKQALKAYNESEKTLKEKYIDLMLLLRRVALSDTAAKTKGVACKQALIDVYGSEWVENTKNKTRKSEVLKILTYLYDLTESKAQKTLETKSRVSIINEARGKKHADSDKPSFIEKIIKCDDAYFKLLDSEDVEELSLKDWQVIRQGLNRLLSICDESINSLKEEVKQAV